MGAFCHNLNTEYDSMFEYKALVFYNTEETHKKSFYFYLVYLMFIVIHRYDSVEDSVLFIDENKLNLDD